MTRNAIPDARSADILTWYDRHARDLPWRVPPGSEARPDPYRIWLSEVMLQQTTVAAVKAYFERFTALWPRVEALAHAQDSDVMAQWAGLGYYARARNLLKCAREVARLGAFPTTEADLMRLPGIGPYTAAAIAAIAFDQPAVVMDGNVERVMARLFNIHTPLPGAKPELKAKAAALTPEARPGDYAQAVMDLGATICTPRNPACGICPWRAPCAARAAGTAEALPVKAPKKAKPTREGVVWVARRADGAWLLEQRPAKGLLGGTLAFPTSDWDGTDRIPPVQTDWHDPGLEVRHTFTHFHLRLHLKLALLPQDAIPDCGSFIDGSQFDPEALPSLMRKAHALAQTVPLIRAKGERSD